MFNSSLKKQALKIHEKTLKNYNSSRERMIQESQNLYLVRIDSVHLIESIKIVINSISNTPKEFETKFGRIVNEIKDFKETEAFAEESYEASIKTGRNIIGGVATGTGIAAMAPTALMSIATTFGTASTGTAISALSGAAAQKAAVAWIGRTFAGFAVKQGAGMAAGNAFLALAGPVGWSITAASTGLSLISLTKKNREIADEAVEVAKDIEKARETVDEAIGEIKSLKEKTHILYSDILKQKVDIDKLLNADYSMLSDENKYFLGGIVNNTLSLSELLNKTIQCNNRS